MDESKNVYIGFWAPLSYRKLIRATVNKMNEGKINKITMKNFIVDCINRGITEVQKSFE